MTGSTGPSYPAGIRTGRPGRRSGAASEDSEALVGWIERVTFHSEETGFCVLRINARGHRDLVTVVGHAATISVGEWVTASGNWVNDRQYGLQFKARFLAVSEPATQEGIEKYLGSGMIRGIGPIYARRLVRRFGTDVFDIIETRPAKLREVEGIGPKRAEQIMAAWADQKAIREIMVFLHQHGVGTARAVRIYKTYGVDAIQVMKENPYQLAADIRGIGFLTADLIAERLGIEKHAMIRVRAGIRFALSEAMGEGHCGLPVTELEGLAVQLLEVPDELVSMALRQELQEGTVQADRVRGTACVFLSSLHRAEQVIARELRRIASGSLSWPEIDAEKALPWVETRTGYKLAEAQSQAVRVTLKSKVTVITGGPGVGKTTIVDAILRILRAKKVTVLFCAPTGRAAKRLSETTGMEAKTIHRLLEFDPVTARFRRSEDHPLECDLLVVDESSMVDVMLMQSLVRAVADHTALLLVGDVDQLPSVGPGQVLSDIIQSRVFPVARLTEIFRQAAESRIVTNAHRINAGEMPLPGLSAEASDFYLVRAEEPEIAVARILTLVSERIPERFGLDPVKDVQVLCPMNRGSVGARSLNIELQRTLNPNPGPSIERFGFAYAPGDKVMQIENDYDKDVYNGDIGTVATVDPEEGELSARFDGRLVAYGFGELDTLVPAYATTIHKSQGSEYPAVVIPLLTQHYTMLQRNLLYTGVTRGRKLVVLVGQHKAVAIAVNNVTSKRRWSRLDECLGTEFRT